MIEMIIELDLGSNPNTEINDFIWVGLNQYYFWQEEVENLADSKNNNAAEYASYLKETTDPSDFFESLKHPDDRFSWIDEDYVNLQNQLAGISSSNGMKFLCYAAVYRMQRIGSCSYLRPSQF